MQQSLSANGISQKFLGTLRRYHVVLFAVFAVGGLAAAVFLLNNTLVAAGTPIAPTNGQSNFDETTLNQIQQMHTSDQVSPETEAQYGLKINQSRINPLITQ